MYNGSVVSMAWPRLNHQVLHHLCPQRMIRLNRICTPIIGARATATKKEQDITKSVVVGSFIFKIPNKDFTQAQVALFRRSAKVHTYPHKLAPCSGRMEESDASPLAAALREIEEETSLPASSLELLCVGRPYSFIDSSINHEWSINPFGFRLKGVDEGGKGEEGIVLDFEHERVEWFNPLEVNSSDEFGGVPRLLDSLQRVWPHAIWPVHGSGTEAGRQ